MPGRSEYCLVWCLAISVTLVLFQFTANKACIARISSVLFMMNAAETFSRRVVSLFVGPAIALAPCLGSVYRSWEHFCRHDMARGPAPASTVADGLIRARPAKWRKCTRIMPVFEVQVAPVEIGN